MSKGSFASEYFEDIVKTTFYFICEILSNQKIGNFPQYIKDRPYDIQDIS